MRRTIVKTGLPFMAVFAFLPLTACFEVENGPAFSGGDEVPGLVDRLYTIGNIEAGEDSGLVPADPGEVEEWLVRRALNGSYVLVEYGDGEGDTTVVRPRHINDGDYVVEYSSAADENWLGILSISGDGDDRQFAFCISLGWDDAEVVAAAPAHGVRADDAGYGGVRVGADDPDALFAFMADLWSRSTITDWDCMVMGAAPSNGIEQDGPGKIPGKN